MKLVAGLVVAVLLFLAAPVTYGRQGGGMGGGSSDPTPFEQFVSKLKLDEKKQLPEVEKIFTAAATEAAPISQELIRVRAQMVAAADNPAELAKAEAAFTAASARMVAAELKAFKQVQALLKPDQLAKSGDAFVLMAGLFNPPTSRGGRSRGGVQ